MTATDDNTGKMYDDMGKMYDKVAALLRKAEDPSVTPEEAEAFFAGAMRLITKHSLDEMRVHAGWSGAAAVELESFELQVVEVPVQVWFMEDASLMNVLAEVNACKVIVSRSRKPYTIWLIGRKSDRERVLMMHAAMKLHLARITKRVPYPYNTSTRDTFVWRRSVRHGFNNGMSDRLQKDRSAAVTAADAESGGSLLPALRKEAQDLDAAVSKIYSSSGYDAGRDASGRVDVGNQRVGTGAGSRSIGTGGR
jgi:hypothetical protein